MILVIVVNYFIKMPEKQIVAVKWDEYDFIIYYFLQKVPKNQALAF